MKSLKGLVLFLGIMLSLIIFNDVAYATNDKNVVGLSAVDLNSEFKVNLGKHEWAGLNEYANKAAKGSIFVPSASMFPKEQCIILEPGHFSLNVESMETTDIYKALWQHKLYGKIR